MRILIVLFLSTFSLYLQAQSTIQFLENVPKEFERNYYNNDKYHEYNPLHVGDIWQYSSGSSIYTTRVIKDTTIIGEIYYKKINYRSDIGNSSIFFNWERNDSINRASYMIDYEDIDNDSDSLEEFLLDSLELSNFTPYTSYRFLWKDGSNQTPTNTFAVDSNWAMIFGDTVMTRLVVYEEFLYEERVADKFGVVYTFNDGPPCVLTGAKIDGIQYGNIVSVKEQIAIPSKVILYQNYPNPFNPTTTIRFSLPQSEYVTLKVYNSLGEEVTTLVSQTMNAGNHSIIWNGSKVSSGIYYYRITAGSFTQTKKLMLLK